MPVLPLRFRQKIAGGKILRRILQMHEGHRYVEDRLRFFRLSRFQQSPLQYISVLDRQSAEMHPFKGFSEALLIRGDEKPFPRLIENLKQITALPALLPRKSGSVNTNPVPFVFQCTDRMRHFKGQRCICLKVSIFFLRKVVVLIVRHFHKSDKQFLDRRPAHFEQALIECRRRFFFQIFRKNYAFRT